MSGEVIPRNKLRTKTGETLTATGEGLVTSGAIGVVKAKTSANFALVKRPAKSSDKDKDCLIL
jgi:hypothetical protein